MAPPSEPRRLGMIGLSANASTSWASSAHLPTLVTPAGKAHYTITALCNSSESAAHAAVKTYGLDSASTATYGDPDSLAADARVQVVSCNTRVDTHYETILPSIKAGKDVYVEWPIAAHLGHVDELVAAARASGSRVAVGLQGRWAPPIVKVRELLQSGIVGKLLSSDLRAFGGVLDRQSLPTGLKYFADKAVGGNPIVIGFGHVIDFIQSVTGDLDPNTTHAQLQIQRPIRKIVNGPDRKVIDEVPTDVPDLVSVHGTLPSSPSVAPNATLSAQFRTGQPFPGHPSLQWTLNCERGEIRLVAPSGISLQAAAYDEPVTIHVHDFVTNAVSEVPWSWSALQEELPVRARCVQHCLYALAEGDESGYVGIEDAARRARQIAGWLGQETFVS